MKRRTLDLFFSIGGAIFAVLLLILGFVLKDQADFANDYVSTQLAAQKITFTPAEALSEEEAAADCLVEHGGELLNSGKEAECYANHYIALHMAESAAAAGYPGETFATMGNVIRGPEGLSAQLEAAKESGDQATIDEAQAAFDTAQGLRSTLQTGETLRGLLLTSYGFSVFGEKAELAAWVCWIGGALLLALSIAGLVHASTKSAKEHTIA